MPTKRGGSVGEMLAARSSEKAILSRGTTGGQPSALAQFLKEKARKKKRPWK